MSIKKVAIVGLGTVGTELMEELLEHKELGLKVVCVSEINDTEGREKAGLAGIPVICSTKIPKLKEPVDIIFDLTGSRKVQHKLRDGLYSTGNKSTIIVNADKKSSDVDPRKANLILSLLSGNKSKQTTLIYNH